MNTKQIIWTLLSIFLFVSTLEAKVYYVTSKGDDSQSGTSVQEAWKSLNKASSFTFNYGDSLLFQGGDTFLGTLEVKKAINNNDKTLYIGSIGKRKATIQAGLNNGIFIHNTSGVVIDNLELIGAGSQTNQGRGIYCLNDWPGKERFANIIINNVDVSGFRWAGIYVGGVPTDLAHGIIAPDGSRFGFENVTIANCRAFDNGYFGIHLSAAYTPEMNDYGNYNVTITQCQAYNNSGDPTYLTNHSGSGIMVDDSRKVTVSYCKAWNNGFLNPSNGGGPAGIWSHVSDSVTIAYCESFANKTNSTKDGAGFDFDAGMTNSIIEYCFSHHNYGAGYLNYSYPGAPKMWNNNIIRNCISLNDGLKNDYAAIYMGTDGCNLTNASFYNNTLINTKASKQFAAGILCYNNSAGGRNSNLHLSNNFIVTCDAFPLMALSETDSALIISGNVLLNLENQVILKTSRKATIPFHSWQEAQRKNNQTPDVLMNSTIDLKNQIDVLISSDKISADKQIIKLDEWIKRQTKRKNIGAGIFSLNPKK